MRRMQRMLFVCAAALAAACSNNPTTGHASLMVNMVDSAKSAWIEPTHAGYMINGMPVNYLGWLIRYSTSTAGTECTPDLVPLATIKIITTDVETSSHTTTDLVPAMIPVVQKLPDTDITVSIAVISETGDATAAFTNGIVTISNVTTIDKKGNGEVDGSLTATGTGVGGAITLNGDFFANKCFL
jgi:hypothetical protein